MNATFKNILFAHVVIFSVFVLFGTFFPAYALTADYKPLVGIPGLSTTQVSTLPDFINKVYIVLISFGAIFGVVKIAFAGVKYSMSDVVTDKGSAIADIKGVLLGLAILLLPAIVLNEINPNLTNLDVLKGATFKLDSQTGKQTSAPAPSASVNNANPNVYNDPSVMP